MPETTASIVIKAQGGEQSAAQLNDVANGIKKVGDNAGTAGPEIAKIGKLESAGIKIFSSAIFNLIPGMQGLHMVARLVSAELKILLGGMGALAGPISLTITALGALTIGWLAHRNAQKDANKENEKALDLYLRLDDKLEAMRDADVKLTPEMSKLNEAIKTQTFLRTQQMAIDTQHLIVQKRKQLATETDVMQQIKLKDEITVLTATMSAQQHGYITLEAELAHMIDTRNKETKAAKDQTAANEKAQQQYYKTAKMIEEQNEHLRKTHQQTAEKVADSVANITGPAINDWLMQTGVLADTTDQNMSRVEKRWKMMSNAIITEMTNLAVKAAALKIFDLLTGGLFGGLFGAAAPAAKLGPAFAYGGVVPGPEGSPQMILAHGGESVTNQKGRGGSGGSPSIVYNNNFSGGIGGLDYRSQRNIARQSRRLVRSVGELPAT